MERKPEVKMLKEGPNKYVDSESSFPSTLASSWLGQTDWRQRVAVSPFTLADSPYYFLDIF